MQPQRQVIPIEVATVTDRGLSQKRPLNEDSYLSDPNRRLFVVADGVGGAQAGEVASQTAVEVLDEAFRHQVNVNDDVEDLMEIAIQRANNSIYQMAREHPKFAAMATTVVALHLDGLTATIGHVGDSRLYRLAPDGRLYQETMDHSVVEEEVRAGRMTREQAANHPSRNVISRALGADANVDVDMKTFTFEDGSAFLLCSDGITRHIPDPEIRELLGSRYSLEKVCEELKRRCYERGAEDNLTAVAIRVGGLFSHPEDDEATVQSARPRESSGDYRAAQLRAPVGGEPIVRTAAQDLPAPVTAPLEPPKKGGGFLKKLFLLLLFLGGIAGAFYGGIVLGHERFHKWTGLTVPGAPPLTQPTPTPDANAALSPAEKARQEFYAERKKVDGDPKAWMEAHPTVNLQTDTAEQLYLAGRAQLNRFLQAKDQAALAEAISNFNAAAAKLPASQEETGPLTRLEIEAARFRAKAARDGYRSDVQQDLDKVLGLNQPPAATGSPAASPAASPATAAPALNVPHNYAPSAPK